MESAYVTVPEMVDLFKNRGFNEKDLGLDLKPGMIAQSLKDATALAAASRSSTDDVERFTLDMSGRFDQSQDKVNFRFNFHYNAETEKVRVSAMGATMGQMKKLYFFGKSDQLVHSKEVHTDLSEMRAKRVLDLNPHIIRQPTHEKARHI